MMNSSLIFCFLLVVFSNCFVTAQVPNYVANNGLLGWWSFNGNTDDNSLNNHNGVNYGALLTTDRFGISSNAYSFDGVDDYIDFGNDPLFSVTTSNALSISLWILANPTTDGVIISKYENNNVASDNWKHLVIVIESGASNSKIYLDGILTNQGSLNIGSNPSTMSMLLGKINQVNNTNFSGKIDDFGIWNRVLTECEIADLYHSQQGFLNTSSVVNETALDAYTWPLNNQTYTQSGIYTTVIPNANGCDSTIILNLTLNFTGMEELGAGAKKLVKITDLNGKIIPRRKNTLMLFIYEDGTVERVVEME